MNRLLSVLAPMTLAFCVASACLARPGDGEKIEFRPISWKAFQERLARNPDKVKFTVVDAWASNCGPCKENFPHLVKMHEALGPKGLGVISLSLDDREDPKALKLAEAFLREKKAAFPNFYVDEESGFEKLGIGAIPAVFLFGPDGKELRRFTMEDPDNQFTYEDVEKAVEALLAGKPLPPERGAKGK